MIALAFVCSAGPVQVDDARDWIDQFAVWSGVVGVLLAGIAIAYAAWQSSQTKSDLVRERRLEFELGVLLQIRRQMSVTEFEHLSGYVGALIRDPQDESELALLRTMAGAKSGPEGSRKREELTAAAKARSVDAQRDLVRAAEEEIDAAIQRRMEG